MKRAFLMLAMLPLLLNTFGQNIKSPSVRNDEKNEIMLIKCFSKDMLEIMINSAGQLWIKTNTNSGFGDIKDIRAKAKDIIKSAPKGHIITVMEDEERGTPQKISDKVKQELKEAYQELRDELAQEKSGKNFKSLKEEEKETIRANYPIRILYKTRGIDFDISLPKLPHPDSIYTDTVHISVKDILHTKRE